MLNMGFTPDSKENIAGHVCPDLSMRMLGELPKVALMFRAHTTVSEVALLLFSIGAAHHDLTLWRRGRTQVTTYHISRKEWRE